MKTFTTYLLALVTLCSVAQETDIDTYLTALYKQDSLNGSVMVVKDDITIYNKSFGYVDSTQTTQLTPEYYFFLGSIYKEFPAVSIMTLQEQNKLTIEDSLSHFFPKLPAWSNDIKIKHLLQYSSGLPTIDFGHYFQTNSANIDQIFNDLRKKEALEFEPSSDYIYSNYNPILLIKIVEQVSGLSFKDYLKLHIFQPNNIEGIVVKQQYPYLDRTFMALPFNENFEEDNYHLGLPSVCANPEGLKQWFMKLDNFEIIQKQHVAELSKTVKAGDNIQSALGSCTWEDGEVKWHEHHGSSGNYECLVQHFPQENLMIIILTNQKHNHVHDMAKTIKKMALSQ